MHSVAVLPPIRCDRLPTGQPVRSDRSGRRPPPSRSLSEATGGVAISGFSAPCIVRRMPATTVSVQRTWTLLGALVLTLMVSVALASCSSSPAGSSGSSTTTGSTGATSTTSAASTSGEQTACALLSGSEVGTTMGVTVEEPTPLVHGAVTTCTYKAAVLAQSVIIEYDISADAKTFAADRSKIESCLLYTSRCV